MISFFAENIGLLGLLVVAGFAAGYAGGLFGIGGGIIMVPAIYAVFQTLGVGEAQSLKTAIGTSLGVIIVTSLRSLMTHHCAGHVDREVLMQWVPWIALGAAIGGGLSKWVPAHLLAVIFVFGGLFIALKRLMPSKNEGAKEHNIMKPLICIPVGLGTGVFCSLLGLGGGALGVMVMTTSGRAMHRAIGTAAGFGVAVALPGIIGFVWAGRNVPGLPLESIGYFNLPAFVVMAIMAAISAPIGARMAHRLDENLLSRMFGVYVLMASTGLFLDMFVF